VAARKKKCYTEIASGDSSAIPKGSVLVGMMDQEREKGKLAHKRKKAKFQRRADEERKSTER